MTSPIGHYDDAAQFISEFRDRWQRDLEDTLQRGVEPAGAALLDQFVELAASVLGVAPIEAARLLAVVEVERNARLAQLPVAAERVAAAMFGDAEFKLGLVTAALIMRERQLDESPADGEH